MNKQTDRKGGRRGSHSLAVAHMDALEERARNYLGKLPLPEGDASARRKALSSLLTGREDAPLEDMEEGLIALAAKAEATRRLDQMVSEQLESQEKEYYDEIRLDILRHRQGPDNARTLSKYARLMAMEEVRLTAQSTKLARPARMQDIVGQRDALQALSACLCSPYPQHVLLYGPPGVGKTSTARLALEYARSTEYTPFTPDAPFVEADGSTLRFDPHEAVNPLLGSVHDPIYQGARKELAGSGVPEPKLGLVSEAHGGVLFIDEIGEMEPALLSKLLKVLEDKRVRFDSSYFDPDDESIPIYIRKLFADGAPADFILVAATTRSPHELPMALRSRCAEVFFRPLEREDLVRVARGAARRMGVDATEGALCVLADEALDGRECVRLLGSAYGRAVERTGNRNARILQRDAKEALRLQLPVIHQSQIGPPQVGRIQMLGVAGRRGCVLCMEAVAVKGTGKLHFNTTAGHSAQDAARNARTALQVQGFWQPGVDIHLNITGGNNVNGPSAGLAMALVMLSAMQNRPLRQDIAVTGEISLHGQILPVGGLPEKVAAARHLGLQVLLPENTVRIQENMVPVANLTQAVEVVFVEVGDEA